MLWWTYQQLRAWSPKTRLAAVEKLAQAEYADSVEPLIFALRDSNLEVRCTAARALSRLRDKRALDPLIEMLRDPAAEARAAAADTLGLVGDWRAVNWLTALLQDPEQMVRSRALRSLERLGWHPRNEVERVSQIATSGRTNQLIEMGSDAIQPLAEIIRTDRPDKQLAAVKALGEMDDAKVINPLLDALKKNDPTLRIAALSALERFGGPVIFNSVSQMLKDKNPHVRAAAVDTIMRCNREQAVPVLVDVLKDPAWEVRQAAIMALGVLGDPAAVEGLCETLLDKDQDVREGAVVALGRIGDARAIHPLVLMLIDLESSVRRAAACSLQQIDRQWQKNPGVRPALPKLKAALEHREYWIRHSASQVLEQIKIHGVDIDTLEPVPEKVQPAAPSEQLPLTAVPILMDLLRDFDRDLRLAAAEALGRLRDKNTEAVLAEAVRDRDPFVQHAAQLALAALN
jgi:HEAT repeat protein